MRAQEPPLSPRLAALKQELEVGNEAALAAFWERVVEEGTPLIEPIPDDAGQALVTFLWRADEATEHVVLVSCLIADWWWNNCAETKFTRLLDTKLHYLTHRVAEDVRFTYRLSPDQAIAHPMDVKDWKKHTDAIRPDPLNPHQYVDDDGIVFSLVEMPDAPSQAWIVPNPETPVGQVELHQRYSEIMDKERRAWVYTPPGYMTEGEAYPLLLLLDGSMYTTDVPAPTIVDNLIAAGRIPPLVAVLVDTPNPERMHELLYHEPLVDFLVKELVAWVHQTYHVTREPARTIVGGVSLSASMAAFAALRHPEVFGNVLCQSAAFHFGPEDDPHAEWLASQFATGEKLPLRFYLEAGVLEDAKDLGPKISLLRANRHMRDVLQAKGYRIHYAEFSGGHEPISWRGTFSDALVVLIGMG